MNKLSNTNNKIIKEYLTIDDLRHQLRLKQLELINIERYFTRIPRSINITPLLYEISTLQYIIIAKQNEIIRQNEAINVKRR